MDLKPKPTGWQSNLSRWCSKHEQITAYCATLNAAGIEWALYSGVTVNLLAGTRMPSDVDIIIRRQDLERVISLSPMGDDTIMLHDDDDTVHCGDGVVLQFPAYGLRFWLSGMQIDVMATTMATYGEHAYDLGMSDLVVQNRLHTVVHGVDMYVAQPFDTMVMKSVLQRGAEQHKFDLEDIAALGNVYPPNPAYMLARAQEVGLDERAHIFLLQAGIALF